MAFYDHGDVHIHYDVEGTGHPVLAIAPGGMRSENSYWSRAPWNPRTALASEYRVVGMDQRNAGRSTAPVTATDGWATYTADHVRLLDHLGIERCHVMGMCIGGPFVLALLTAAPERFTAAVLLQPVGIEDNRDILRGLFDEWSAEIAPQHPEATAQDWSSFGDNVWNGEFVLTATREQVAAIETPMLVLMGNDQYHPSSASREVAELAPNATLVERWRDDDVLAETHATVTGFLAAHTP